MVQHRYLILIDLERIFYLSDFSRTIYCFEKGYHRRLFPFLSPSSLAGFNARRCNCFLWNLSPSRDIATIDYGLEIIARWPMEDATERIPQLSRLVNRRKRKEKKKKRKIRCLQRRKGGFALSSRNLDPFLLLHFHSRVARRAFLTPAWQDCPCWIIADGSRMLSRFSSPACARTHEFLARVAVKGSFTGPATNRRRDTGGGRGGGGRRRGRKRRARKRRRGVTEILADLAARVSSNHLLA